MISVHTADTTDLDAAVLAAARALLENAFAGDWSDHDWEHSLGGMHALIWEGRTWSGTRPSSSGGCCTVGGRCVRATSRASALTPTGIRRTEADDGSIYVLEGAAPLDLTVN